MISNEKASYIVNKLMLEKDEFSKWLGIKIIEIIPGYCKLCATVNDSMLNGFSIAHGGIAYSIADSALAFAANSHGIQCVSIETSISHLKKVTSGETIYAEAQEKSISKSLAVYDVILTSSENYTIALFKGTVFRTNKEWGLPNEMT